jgi:hypothetical protein
VEREVHGDVLRPAGQHDQLVRVADQLISPY